MRQFLSDDLKHCPMVWEVAFPLMMEIMCLVTATIFFIKGIIKVDKINILLKKNYGHIYFFIIFRPQLTFYYPPPDIINNLIYEGV